MIHSLTELSLGNFLVTAPRPELLATAYLQLLTGDLATKVALPILTGALGFLGSYALNERNLRRQPHKRLSYQKEVSNGVRGIAEGIKDKARITYNGEMVEDIYYASVNLINSGNTVIKKQYVRVEVPDTCRIIDDYFEPLPEPEMGALQVEATKTDKRQRRYFIDHLEHGEQLSLRVVFTGPVAQLGLHPFNEEGDVQFVEESAVVVQDQSVHVMRFLFFAILLILLPSLLPGSLDVFALPLALILFLFLVPHIRPFAQVMTQLIARSLDRSSQAPLASIFAPRITMRSRAAG